MSLVKKIRSSDTNSGCRRPGMREDGSADIKRTDEAILSERQGPADRRKKNRKNREYMEYIKKNKNTKGQKRGQHVRFKKIKTERRDRRQI